MIALMAKKEQRMKLQKRDWAIIILLIAIMAVGWYAYQVNQARLLSESANSQAWLNHQVQINKLKACIDTGTKPCDINPQIAQ